MGVFEVNLVNVYDISSELVLYRLLEGRPKHANISHREMPDWKEHQAFVRSKPYTAWYLIIKQKALSGVYGSVYLTKDNEIGVFLFKKYQGKGFGQDAIWMLMEKHPRKRYLANINPENEGSIGTFEGLGFHHIQNTYEFNV